MTTTTTTTHDDDHDDDHDGGEEGAGGPGAEWHLGQAGGEAHVDRRRQRASPITGYRLTRATSANGTYAQHRDSRGVGHVVHRQRGQSGTTVFVPPCRGERRWARARCRTRSPSPPSDAASTTVADAPQAAHSQFSSRPATLPVMAGERLLLVDDEDNLRSMLEAALRHLGFEVHPAANGRDALDAVADGAARPDRARRDAARPRRLRGVPAAAHRRRAARRCCSSPPATPPRTRCAASRSAATTTS